MNVPSKPAGRVEDQLPVRMLRFVNRIFARIYHRLDVYEPCRLPHTGAGILVSNHISSLDPMLLQAVSPRLIVWMMAKEYLELPGSTWFFKTIGIIGVARSGKDLSSTRAALRALQDGRIVGIFPEGRISTTNDFNKFQTGVAMLAIKANVPIYPAYVDGTQRNQDMLRACVWRNEARVAFGEPFMLDETDTSKESLDRATEKIRSAIAGLRDKHHIGPKIR